MVRKIDKLIIHVKQEKGIGPKIVGVYERDSEVFRSSERIFEGRM